MGQTLSEPVVEKVRVCAVLKCATDLVLNSSPAVTTHQPGLYTVQNPLWSVTVSFSYRNKIFCHSATLAWLATVFTKHSCSTVTTLTLINNILCFTDFLKRRR